MESNPVTQIPKIPPPELLFCSPYAPQNNTSIFKDGQEIHSRKIATTSPVTYTTKKFIKAGPRSELFRNPLTLTACIVTCGGLCPGLNTCIYTIYQTLNKEYCAKQVYGIYDGYKGMADEDYWFSLNDSNIYDKFNQPGTFLRSSRGKQDMSVIVKNLVKHNVNAVFIIGGEGSHFGAKVLQAEIDKSGLDISVAAIPKTIDNDIPVIDQSFGHATAIDVGVQAIHSAYSEAQSIECCLGLVKVMGRDTGHIAVNAALAFGWVDVVLIPEIPFELYGEKGLLAYMYHLMVTKKRVVMVVAEGANKNLIDGDLSNEGKDQSGNTKFGDIGLYLKSLITNFLKTKKDEILKGFTIKYIDPSYMLRSCVPNSFDRRMCLDISSDSVHGVMAGYKGFSTGVVSGETVYIPLESICEVEREDVHWGKENYQRLMRVTRQPAFRNLKK